jgi:hypothetical protein
MKMIGSTSLGIEIMVFNKESGLLAAEVFQPHLWSIRGSINLAG